MRATRWWLPALVAVFVLAGAANASAATCTYSSSGNWTTGGSCGSTPASTDTVVIDSGVNVTVDANRSIAGITMNGGTITFAGSPTLTDSGGFTSTTNDTLTGPGTLTVAGTETHSADQLAVRDAANLILNSTGGIGGGNVCLIGNAAGTADDPSLQINGTFTIGSGAADTPISCNSGDDSAVLRVGATGTLVDTRSGPGPTTIGAPMQVAQGGLVHVTAGTLQVVSGSKGATDDGHWSVDTGRTLLFNDSGGGTTFGTHTTIDGAGALNAQGALTFPAGATFTIPDVTIGGTLTLDDNATPYTPTSITFAGGTLAGDRDVTPGSLVDTSGGILDGNFTTTITSSATLTVSALLEIANGSDFILNKDLTLGSGADICLIGTGVPSDDPSFQINSTFTIGPAADASPFSCNSGVTAPGIKVNPTGTFVDARAGTTSIGPP
jgi:fibronectin-binding autotransporter adhesin